jgi:RIO-like serine/threonine protein kinase
LLYCTGLLDRGSQFHAAIHNYLSGTPKVDLKLDQVEGCWKSVANVITDVTDVRVLESHVVHSDLLYRGVIDCAAQYK